MEQIAFGVDRDRSKDHMREAIEIVTRMWESEYFEYHSESFDFPRRMVTPKPYQDPHPPAWMAATSEGSSAMAGRYGLGLLSFSILQPLEHMAKHIRDYREAIAQPQPITRVINNQVASYTLVHCADTFEQAEANGIWDSVWWWYQNLSQFTLDWEFAHFSEEEKDKLFPLLKKHSEGKFNVRGFNDAD